MSSHSTWDLTVSCARLQQIHETKNAEIQDKSSESEGTTGLVRTVIEHFSNSYELHSSSVKDLCVRQFFSACALLHRYVCTYVCLDCFRGWKFWGMPTIMLGPGVKWSHYFISFWTFLKMACTSAFSKTSPKCHPLTKPNEQKKNGLVECFSVYVCMCARVWVLLVWCYFVVHVIINMLLFFF